MAESKVNDENYFQVSGWMLNQLGLKGTTLQVFAIIYGFSQDGESYFTGSLQYLSDFTNTSKPTIIKSLKELVDKNIILKTENEMNGVKFNKYKANLQLVKKLKGGSKETLLPIKETLLGGSKETLHNNKDINNKNIINNNIKYIVEYLNKKARTSYRADTKETVTLLTGLLTKGEKPYTVEDITSVIDKKCSEWLGTEFEQYLRPKTLFGNKFESYLNAKIVPKKETGRKEPTPSWMNKFNNFENRTYDMEDLERKLICVDTPKTVGNDPDLREKAELLKLRIREKG